MRVSSPLVVWTHAVKGILVETIARIRRDCFGEGKAAEEIGHDMETSRNTPRKALRQAARGTPMDYLDNLHRAKEGSTLNADRGSMFNAD